MSSVKISRMVRDEGAYLNIALYKLRGPFIR